MRLHFLLGKSLFIKKNAKLMGTILITFLLLIVIENQGIFTRVYFYLKKQGLIDRKVDLSEIINNRGVMVALTLGQSNAANNGQSRYIPHNKILNYADGKLFIANDPLVGADGSGGSVWGILGDLLIDSGLFKKVIIIPIGMGGTSISCWSDSSCHNKLVKTLQDLNDHKIRLTHIFWHQGESDMGTPKSLYKNQLIKILLTIRKYNQVAPFYCSIASYHPQGLDSNVHNAQIEFIKENKDVLFGSNTDTIIQPNDRYQDVHFTKTGMKKYAQSWFSAVKQGKEN